MTRLLKKDLIKFVNKNIYKLLADDYYIKYHVNAKDLLSVDRVDVIVKYLYVKFKEENIECDFSNKLYLKHINLINGFYENDESKKIGKNSFLKSFDLLIYNIKNFGFENNSLIPLNKDNSILDGSHRLSCALYFNHQLPVFNLNFKGQKLNFSFFKKIGLSTIELDYLAHNFTILKGNLHAVHVWPSAVGKDDELVDTLNSFGKIIYRKNIDLSLTGLVNLIRQVYSKESWLGTYKNDFSGARNKARWCYKPHNSLRFFLIESSEDLVILKNEIREIFNIGKHSVHINDEKYETILSSKLLLNQNSVHWLNNCGKRFFNKYDSLLQSFKEWIKFNNLDENNFAVIGGALAIYGYKNSHDLDFITTYNDLPTLSNDFIELELEKLNYTKQTLHDLIHDPKNYFYYYGIKIINLNVIEEIKSNRFRSSDIDDLKILRALINNKGYKKSFSDYFSNFFKASFYLRNIKFILLKVRFALVFFIKKIHRL